MLILETRVHLKQNILHLSLLAYMDSPIKVKVYSFEFLLDYVP